MIKKVTDLHNARGLQLDSSMRRYSSSRSSVLVALDGTSIGEVALKTAIALARHWDAPLRLLHVRDPVARAYDTDLCVVDNGTTLSVRSREGAYLESLAETLSDSNDLSVDFKSATGFAIADTLRSICESDVPRLLVMARNRRSKLSRFFTGSVTTRLLDDLPAPLLLVPAEDHDSFGDLTSTCELNRIFVPLDGTEATERVLDHVISVASEDTICHIRRVVPLASLNSTSRGEISRGEFFEGGDIRGEAWRELFHARDRLERHGIQCTTRVLFDRQPLAATVAQAKALQALVILAAPQKSLLPWWLRSNLADSIRQQADVPVMIVPRNKRESISASHLGK